MKGRNLSEVTMAGKAQTLTCTFFVGRERVDKLTDDQVNKMAQKIGEAMSSYYTAHPIEYQKIKGK